MRNSARTIWMIAYLILVQGKHFRPRMGRAFEVLVQECGFQSPESWLTGFLRKDGTCVCTIAGSGCRQRPGGWASKWCAAWLLA